MAWRQLIAQSMQTDAATRSQNPGLQAFGTVIQQALTMGAESRKARADKEMLATEYGLRGAEGEKTRSHEKTLAELGFAAKAKETDVTEAGAMARTKETAAGNIANTKAAALYGRYPNMAAEPGQELPAGGGTTQPPGMDIPYKWTVNEKGETVQEYRSPQAMYSDMYNDYMVKMSESKALLGKSGESVQVLPFDEWLEMVAPGSKATQAAAGSEVPYADMENTIVSQFGEENIKDAMVQENLTREEVIRRAYTGMGK